MSSSPFSDWLDASGYCEPGLYAGYRARLEPGEKPRLFEQLLFRMRCAVREQGVLGLRAGFVEQALQRRASSAPADQSTGSEARP